ncbi:2OG-Fe(II) oxygenase [bacterium]|nr:2OG-Fe(II) oxygenase [bacterium]
MRNNPKHRLSVLKRFFNENVSLNKDIVVFKNFLTQEELKTLNKNFLTVNDWAGIESQDENLVDETTKMHYIEDKNIDSLLFNITNKIIKTYSVIYPETSLLIRSDQGYRYNHYKNDEGYFYHIDCSSKKEFYRQRLISCVIQLNSDYEGGLLAFPYQNFSIKLKAGDVIMFPSIHTHPHKVLPVTKGERKNVVTWFI